MSDSRTKNSARNAAVSLSFYAAYTIAGFVLRRVFIDTLGNDYLSVSGLFTNILTVLSFAEMGIGNAIIFNLYKPIATGDTEKIKSLMKLYKKAYNIIGAFVFGAGLLLIPFLNYLISGEAPDIKESLVLLYVLYLFNTAFSYFFTFKQAIITANQKNYIVSAYTNIFKILQLVLQGIFLVLTHNFIVYLLIQIACTVINNVILAAKADKMFPYIRDKEFTPIPKEERKSIFKNVRALFLYKLGSTVLNGTDNLIITKVIALASVGLTSNFTMIISAISSVVDTLPNAVVASVGNLNASESKEKKNQIFDIMFFVCVWIYGLCASGVYFFSNDFVSIVFGSEWRMEPIVIFSLALHFYVSSVMFPSYTYRTTLGYFVQGRFAPVAASVINIVLSILMGKWIGLSGVFFATSISRFLTMGIVDPVLIYKNCFKRNPLIYYARYFICFALVAGISFASYRAVSFIPLEGTIGFAVKVAAYVVLFNGLAVLVSFRTKEFRYLKNIVSEKVIKKFLKKAGR